MFIKIVPVLLLTIAFGGVHASSLSPSSSFSDFKEFSSVSELTAPRTNKLKKLVPVFWELNGGAKASVLSSLTYKACVFTEQKPKPSKKNSLQAAKTAFFTELHLALTAIQNDINDGLTMRNACNAHFDSTLMESKFYNIPLLKRELIAVAGFLNQSNTSDSDEMFTEEEDAPDDFSSQEIQVEVLGLLISNISNHQSKIKTPK
jgi:hypothetical protein